jgi:pilus assembly protein CpaC
MGKLSQGSWILRLGLLVCAALCAGQQPAPAGSDSNPSDSQQVPATQSQAPAAAQSVAPAEEEGPAPLRVMVGKSLLINTTDKLKRVSVTDPEIADALVVTATQVLVHGRAPGEVSLLIWDEFERSRSFDLRVDVDVTAAREEIKRIFPDEQIDVSASRSAIVLSGHVTTEDVQKHAGMVAAAYSKNVINVLTFGPIGAQEVLLEVKFAEVDRAAVTQLGLNVFSTGAANTTGTSTTGQFGGFQTGTGSTGGTGGSGNQPNINFNQPLNLFLFRQDINLGALIQALQQKNLLEILAEPNLIAVNGKEASFLAGGEFPFPIVQPGQGFTAVTIQFREFGVKLRFTPVVMPNSNIHLQVVPEVSQLDFTNALTISGFTVPALSTRRAQTEFEVQDGQSFVIAGLMDNRVTNQYSKMPGLGDIPILGNLFRSKNLQKSTTELVVLCTVHRIAPNGGSPEIPKYPQPFMDKGKFDGKGPSTSGAKQHE